MGIFYLTIISVFIYISSFHPYLFSSWSVHCRMVRIKTINISCNKPIMTTILSGLEELLQSPRDLLRLLNDYVLSGRKFRNYAQSPLLNHHQWNSQLRTITFTQSPPHLRTINFTHSPLQYSITFLSTV